MNHFIEIQNLKCGGCAKTVIDTLNKVESINTITVDIDKSMVSFFSEDASALPIVEKKLSEIGYPPVGSKNSVITKAKSFVSCATGKMSS
ncbi:MAG: heavy metal-associated domain-containing protein [Flavobacteriaceae bacterium]|nr:heavy-metal-associated domain-containing protein [Flavobacteriaceae bacterium]